MKPLVDCDPITLPSARADLITETIVETVIREFKKGTASRGLRPQHLVDALNSEARTQILTQITKTVRFLAEAPIVFAPFLSGASLTALDKTKDDVFDVRPIASGEVLRRIVAKCLCATQKASAGKYFVAGGQFGVACEAGMERVIYHTRSVVQRETCGQAAVEPEQEGLVLEHEHMENTPKLDFVILKVDLKNAFNRVSRYHILRLVKLKFPALARWVTWTYGNDDPFLWFRGGMLHSQEGVQQGDPLGPLLFSMVIQQLVDAIRVACPRLALNCWYLDDGVLAGKAADVLKALHIIQTLGPDLGMDLNLKKNELVKFDHTDDDFPPECMHFYRNFNLLGSPIGDEDYCTKYITNYVKERVEHMPPSPPSTTRKSSTSS